MGYTWIPHVFDTLPFFQMDAESRRTFLEEAFGIRDGVCSDRGFDLPGGQSIRMSIIAESGDRELGLRMTFGQREGIGNGSVTLLIKDSGLVRIEDFESGLESNSRYVLKDIVLILRRRFSPLYDSDIWGRDQFKISDADSESEALSDLIGQMTTSLQQMVEEMMRMVNMRLGNRYDEVAGTISASVTRRDETDRDFDLDELKAATRLNLANMNMDSEIGDRWNVIRMYGQACGNLMSIFDIPEDVRNRVDNTISYGETLFDSIGRRRELDLGSLELKAQRIGIEQTENARIQAENTDRLSTFVAMLTAVATVLTLFQFIGDEVDPELRPGFYVISVVAVAAVFMVVHLWRRRARPGDGRRDAS